MTDTPYINSNMTPREVLGLHGYLPESIALEVIDKAEFAETAADAVCDIEEANYHPAEDFAQSIIDQMRMLTKHMRGDNRAGLLSLCEALEQLQLETFHDGEYRREKLNAAIKALTLDNP